MAASDSAKFEVIERLLRLKFPGYHGIIASYAETFGPGDKVTPEAVTLWKDVQYERVRLGFKTLNELEWKYAALLAMVRSSGPRPVPEHVDVQIQRMAIEVAADLRKAGSFKITKKQVIAALKNQPDSPLSRYSPERLARIIRVIW